MTTIVHYVDRMTSAWSSEELAESHVNKLFGWQLMTPSHRGEARMGLGKHQVATHRPSHLRHLLPLDNDI
jgi:hypothetical protein